MEPVTIGLVAVGAYALYKGLKSTLNQAAAVGERVATSNQPPAAERKPSPEIDQASADFIRRALSGQASDIAPGEIMAFQVRWHLPVTGVLDDLTMRAVHALAPYLPAIDSAPAAVQPEIQDVAATPPPASPASPASPAAPVDAAQPGLLRQPPSGFNVKPSLGRPATVKPGLIRRGLDRLLDTVTPAADAPPSNSAAAAVAPPRQVSTNKRFGQDGVAFVPKAEGGATPPPATTPPLGDTRGVAPKERGGALATSAPGRFASVIPVTAYAAPATVVMQTAYTPVQTQFAIVDPREAILQEYERLYAERRDVGIASENDRLSDDAVTHLMRRYNELTAQLTVLLRQLEMPNLLPPAELRTAVLGSTAHTSVQIPPDRQLMLLDEYEKLYDEREYALAEVRSGRWSDEAASRFSRRASEIVNRLMEIVREFGFNTLMRPGELRRAVLNPSTPPATNVTATPAPNRGGAASALDSALPSRQRL